MNIDRELQAALDVDPSPEFVARVRTRIAGDPEPSRWTMPSWIVVGAIATAALVVIGVAVRPRPAPALVNPLLASRSLDVIRVPEVHAPPRASVGKATVTQLLHPAIAVDDSDQVMLDAREMFALRRLIGVVGNGRLDLEPAVKSTPVPFVEPRPVDVLAIPEIPPIPAIVIDPLPVGGEGAVR